MESLGTFGLIDMVSVHTIWFGWVDLKQGVRAAKVHARKLAFATLGGGDSPILNPTPVLGPKLVVLLHWRLLCWLVLDGVVGWLEEELGQLA